MTKAVVVTVAALLLAASATLAWHGGTRSASYDRGDVEEAFARQGLTLIDTGLFGTEGERAEREALLSPTTAEPFWVFIARTDALAERQHEPYARLRTAESLDLLRGNVMAISDSGLSPRDRRRIRAAMQELSHSPR